MAVSKWEWNVPPKGEEDKSKSKEKPSLGSSAERSVRREEKRDDKRDEKRDEKKEVSKPKPKDKDREKLKIKERSGSTDNPVKKPAKKMDKPPPPDRPKFSYSEQFSSMVVHDEETPETKPLSASEEFGTLCIRDESEERPKLPWENESPAETSPKPSAGGPEAAFGYREPEPWEKNILALEKGEWDEENMSDEAFKKYRKERPSFPSVFMRNTPGNTQDVAAVMERQSSRGAELAAKNRTRLVPPVEKN